MKGKAFFKSASRLASRHGSTVLTILSIIGVGITAYLSSKAGREADENIKRAKEDKLREMAEENEETPDFSKVDDVELTKKERFVCKAKAYWKPGVAILLTIACGVGSHLFNMKQVSDLMATANVATTVHSKYVEKTRAVAGDEVADDIQHQVDVDCAESSYKSMEKIVYTGCGDQLFYDVMCNRWFYSSVNAVERAIDMLNNDARNGGCDEDIVWMNDVYDAIGLSGTQLGYATGKRVKDNSSRDTIVLDLNEARVNKDDGKSYIIFKIEGSPDVFDKERFNFWGY